MRFLFLFMSVLGIGAVVLLYQEITRLAGDEPRFSGDAKDTATFGGNGDTNRGQGPNLLLHNPKEVPVDGAAEDVERFQPRLYDSQDQLEAVSINSLQSVKDENWVEYTTNVRDPVNERFYFLLNTGGSNTNLKRFKQLNKDQLWSAGFNGQSNMYSSLPDADAYNFENDNNKNGDVLQYPNRDGLRVSYEQSNSKHVVRQKEGLANREGQIAVLGHGVKPSARRVVPPAPHSLYRQPQGSARYLVYVCDAESLCGGWGDRQRGMVSTYFLSRLVGRQLKIAMSTPCDLMNFYIPNRVPWVLAHAQLDAFSNVSVNVFTAKARKLIANHMLDRDFNELYPQQVVYLKTNQDYYRRLEKNPFYQDTIRKWTGLAEKKSRFQWAWKDMMRPSPRLLAQLERVLGSTFLVRRRRLAPNKGYMVHSMNDMANSSLICAHVRFGKNPSFPNDNERFMFSLTDLPLLFKFMLSKDTFKTARFYLASDYQLVKDKAKEYFTDRVLDVGVTVTHIDRQREGNNACNGFESALLDQQILSLCDVLVVSRSGFSIHASYMAPAPQEVYIMQDGSIADFVAY
ncbi:hypothetical protein ElyMa_004988500 [Elysia marginata]|uniref:L-Fucosyltransferase n=1 Tax=Elysia marginata TaxID=1093978 RepID=A0AAV4JAQ5_9GAST|nr:hypothetical protein ElyMa_004988500 [Elysia marginata]